MSTSLFVFLVIKLYIEFDVFLYLRMDTRLERLENYFEHNCIESVQSMCISVPFSYKFHLFYLPPGYS